MKTAAFLFVNFDTSFWASTFFAGLTLVNTLGSFQTCGFTESAQDVHIQNTASELDLFWNQRVRVCNSSNTCHTRLYVVMQHCKF